MSDLELIDAVAHVTGEDAHEIQRRGFVLTGPDDSGEHAADASDPAIFTIAPHEEPFHREWRNSSSKTPSDALAPAVIRTSAVQLTSPDAVSTRYARCLITFISEASGSSAL